MILSLDHINNSINFKLLLFFPLIGLLLINLVIQTNELINFMITNMIINIGPQHPATHGVLRLIVMLGGEIMLWIIHEIGLLHSGTEKLIESIHINSIIGYFDSLDYVSNLSQELLFIQLIEKLLNCYLIDYISLWSMFFLEFYSNLNHLLNITTHAIDLGLFTTMLLLFDESEKLINYISIMSGTSFHVSLLLIGNLSYDLTLNWIKSLFCWLSNYGIIGVVIMVLLFLFLVLDMLLLFLMLEH